MKIIVAVRCRNEEKNIERFLHGYDFSDLIVVSDGGSTDKSVELLKQNKKVKLFHFEEEETINDVTWNPDGTHMNFVLDKAKELEPDWLLFDDMDCCPNSTLQSQARDLLWTIEFPQVNAFRLYMWGDAEYFPKMNDNFNPEYVSLWGWKPKEVNIYADQELRHGTLVGLTDNHYKVLPPLCLLHKSWHPDTIEDKIKRYTAVGLHMEHPFKMANAGTPVALPEWVVEK